MSTKFQFPLLKLPWVCLEHFLNSSRAFDVFDLITFSLISERCYQIVKSLKHRELRCYDIHIRNAYIQIDFIRTETKGIGKWKFNLGEEWKTNPFMELYYFQPDDDNWVPARVVQLLMDDSESTAVNAFRYLMTLFPRPVDDINLDLDESNQSERIFEALAIDQCELLTIRRKNKMSKSELIRILKITKIKRTINFYVDLESGFPYENDLLLPPKIQFARGQTHDTIFQLKANLIAAWNCKLSEVTPNDFIDFVMRWYNSDDISFQMLFLHWREGTGELDLETVLPLDTHEYDEKRRERYVRLNRSTVIDTSIGCDFQRSDGLWATILRSKIKKALVFCVWHDCSSTDFIFNGSEKFL